MTEPEAAPDEALGNRIDRLDTLSNKGLHSNVSYAGANRLLLSLIVVAHDLMSLRPLGGKSSYEPYTGSIREVFAKNLRKERERRSTDDEEQLYGSSRAQALEVVHGASVAPLSSSCGLSYHPTILRCMGLGDIRYEDIIAATEEFRRLGRDNFLQTYGFGRAKSYELVLDGFRYDSKAIAGVAHGHATGDFLSSGDFSGGAVTVARRLRELGFVVETGGTSRNRAALLERLRKLRVSRGPGNPAPSRHQPLSLLWAISREADERPRMTPWSQFREEVGPLLVEFGLPNAKATPEYPFWHLRGSGLWEVQGIPAELAKEMPKVSILDAHHPQAGFKEEVAGLLRDPVTRLDAIATICETYLENIDRQVLFERIGMDGYTTAGSLLSPSEVESSGADVDEYGRVTGPAPRRDATRSVIVRDEALARKVKELEGDQCQVCGTVLRYLNRPYSEAAHIRGLGRPHHGPDELQNLLCLCANCHVLFDGLEIYIDPDGLVRGTRDSREPRPLRRDPRHPMDEAHVGYHRNLCNVNARKPAVG